MEYPSRKWWNGKGKFEFGTVGTDPLSKNEMSEPVVLGPEAVILSKIEKSGPVIFGQEIVTWGSPRVKLCQNFLQ